MFSVCTLRILAYWPLILLIDKLSAVGSQRHPNELRRLYSENLALKASNEALRKELRKLRNASGKGSEISVRARMQMVIGYLLNRENVRFQKRYLGASRTAVKKWVTRFRHPFAKPKRVGRPPIDQALVNLILQIKRDNPRFGSVKIEKTLAQMGIKVSRYTICKVLKANGLDPIDDNRPAWKKWAGQFADEVWAMDFCFTQLRNGMEAMIFVACDTFTKEIMEVQVFRGRDWISANDVAATLGRVLSRFKRRPQKIVHDRDPLFGGQVMRMLAVEEIKQLKSPPRYPTMNCFAERTIQSIKHELLDHVRAESPEDLQRLLDEFAVWFNQYRAHEGLGGITPTDYAAGQRIEHVVPIRDLTDGTLKRIEFADGLLTGYRWAAKSELAEAA